MTDHFSVRFGKPKLHKIRRAMEETDYAFWFHDGGVSFAVKTTYPNDGEPVREFSVETSVLEASR